MKKGSRRKNIWRKKEKKTNKETNRKIIQMIIKLTVYCLFKKKELIPVAYAQLVISTQ